MKINFIVYKFFKKNPLLILNENIFKSYLHIPKDICLRRSTSFKCSQPNQTFSLFISLPKPSKLKTRNKSHLFRGGCVVRIIRLHPKKSNVWFTSYGSHCIVHIAGLPWYSLLSFNQFMFLSRSCLFKTSPKALRRKSTNILQWSPISNNILSYHIFIKNCINTIFSNLISYFIYYFYFRFYFALGLDFQFKKCFFKKTKNVFLGK